MMARGLLLVYTVFKRQDEKVSKIKTYEVRQSGAQWIVKVPHSLAHMSIHDTKDEALQAATQTGRLTPPAVVVVFGAKGGVETRHSID
jgi:hypothetical protein